MLKRRLKEPFGKAGLIVAAIALVFAMLGGAYAATGGSSGKATASAKQGKQGPRGKTGKTGPAGPAGPAGAQGPGGPAGAKGDAGAAGSNGTNGTNGTPGAPGTSVTNTTLAKGSVTCPEGGAEFKVGAGAPTHACNGTTGYTETLPPGKTETGAWSISQSATTEMSAYGSVSFPIPLEQPGAEGTAFGFNEEETASETFNSHCPGSLAEPDAEPGFLCVYTQFENVKNGLGGFIEPRNFENGFGAYGVSGAVLNSAFLEGAEGVPAVIESYGTWAVTAPLAGP
jgi:hypothetical protein